MEKKQTRLGTQCEAFDWVPSVLRSTSGFNACLTVVITSVIFVLTMHDAVLKTDKGWFNWMEIMVMLIGPVIIAWNFVNVSPTLESVINTVDNDECQEPPKPCPRNTVPKGYITEADSAREREVFGTSVMLMRALVGFISAHAICFISLVYTWTIREAVLGNKVMPGEFDILVAVIGPIVVSWNFVRAANTINILISGGTAFMNVRTWLANFIAPRQK